MPHAVGYWGLLGCLARKLTAFKKEKTLYWYGPFFFPTGKTKHRIIRFFGSGFQGNHHPIDLRFLRSAVNKNRNLACTSKIVMFKLKLLYQIHHNLKGIRVKSHEIPSMNHVPINSSCTFLSEGLCTPNPIKPSAFRNGRAASVLQLQ